MSRVCVYFFYFFLSFYYEFIVYKCTLYVMYNIYHSSSIFILPFFLMLQLVIHT